MPLLSPGTPSTAAVRSPQILEADVRQKLLNESGLNFSSLVVRRVADGVCLEGVLEIFEEDVDVAATALRVDGVENVHNHLLVRQACAPSANVASPSTVRSSSR